MNRVALYAARRHFRWSASDVCDSDYASLAVTVWFWLNDGGGSADD